VGACRPAVLAVVAASAALGLSACGGDNDPAGEPPTTTPPTPAETKPQSAVAANFPDEFKQKVDPICVKAQQQIDKVAGTRARSQAAVDKLAGYYGDAAKQLGALDPPADSKEAYGEFTHAWQSGQKLFSDLSAEVGRGDSSAFQRVPSILDQTNTQIKDLAQQYGFKACGSD
jgi:hypothetical protein